MNKQREKQLDETLARWEATDAEHRAYRQSHPDKPLTPSELKWLEDYQKMTRDPRWW